MINCRVKASERGKSIQKEHFAMLREKKVSFSAVKNFYSREREKENTLHGSNTTIHQNLNFTSTQRRKKREKDEMEFTFLLLSFSSPGLSTFLCGEKEHFDFGKRENIPVMCEKKRKKKRTFPPWWIRILGDRE